MEGCCCVDSVLVLRRGFWVRVTEPRDFWEVLSRREEREEKNWFCVSIGTQSVASMDMIPLRYWDVVPSPCG